MWKPHYKFQSKEEAKREKKYVKIVKWTVDKQSSYEDAQKHSLDTGKFEWYKDLNGLVVEIYDEIDDWIHSPFGLSIEIENNVYRIIRLDIIEDTWINYYILKRDTIPVNIEQTKYVEGTLLIL